MYPPSTKRLTAVFLFVAFSASAQKLQPPREIRAHGLAAQSVSGLTPLSLATGDFDVDGYPDLACGYAEGRVVIYFGSERAFRRIGVGDPFRDEVFTIDVPVRADILVAGDFDDDGNTDLLVATRGDNSAYVLKKGTGAPRRTVLPVPVTEANASVPMRLGVDARPGMALLLPGHHVPLIAMPESVTPYTVTGFSDAVGSCDANHVCTSLRAAVIASNFNPGADTIQLNAGTYTLSIAPPDDGGEAEASYGDLDINDSLTIVGDTPANTIITTTYGPSCGDCRVFDVNSFGDPGLTVGLNNLTIQNGYATCRNGGGILFTMIGTTNYSVSNSVITNNHALGNPAPCGYGSGGGVAVVSGADNGSLTFANTTISNNSTEFSGGGLFIGTDQESVTLTNTKLIGNQTSYEPGNVSKGGGLYVSHQHFAVITVNGDTIDPATPCVNSSSAICNNTAYGTGGGVIVTGPISLRLTNTKVSGNTAAISGSGSSIGGGILTNADQMILTTSEVSNNQANPGGDGRGGGIANSPINPIGSTEIDDSTISGNTANLGGGVYSTGGFFAMNGGNLSANTGGQGSALHTFATTYNANVNNVNIEGNTPAGNVSTIYAPFGYLDVHFCRFFNNGTGKALDSFAGVNASENWWGTNTPTAAMFGASVTFNPYYKLRASASPGALCAGDSSTITADFRTDSIGSDVSTHLGVFTGRLMAFDGGSLGTVSPASVPIDGTAGPTAGTAATTFTEGSAAGSGQATATFDNAVVQVPLSVQYLPSLTTSFSPGTVGTKQIATLSFAMQNSTATAISNVNFTDTLPSGLEVAPTPNLVSACGTLTATSGSGTITFSGGTIAANSTCTVKVDVRPLTAGSKDDSTTIHGGSCGGVTAMSSLSVLAAPQIAKSFDVSSMPVGGVAILTFTLSNPNASTALSGVAFTDNFPSGLVVDTPNGVVNQCGGTFSAVAGAATVALSGASLAANGNCTVALRVSATTTGVLENTTGQVTSSNGGIGNTATASINVNSCTYAIDPSSALGLDTLAHGGTITVTTSPSCSWTTLSSDPAWLTAGPGGTGNGTVSYSITQNFTVFQRSGTIRIGGQTFAVTQDGVQPSMLTATAASTGDGTPVALMWTSAPIGGGQFEIWRNNGTSPSLGAVPIGTTTATSFIDTTAAPDTAYVYAVRATDADAHSSAFTNHDLAVTTVFLDDPFGSQTAIKLDHLIQWRHVIDLVRASAGLGGYPWNDAAVADLPIKAGQINEFTTALSGAWTPLGLPTYAPPDVVAGAPIDAARFNALRSVLK